MLSRREFLRVTAAGTAALALPHAAFGGRDKGRERPPNIVFIIADDLGWADLGCYGSRAILTPHIDRLAAEGMRFRTVYSGCTVCAPARSTLMTGLHMGHTPVRLNTGGVPLAAEDVTVAQLLKAAGYTCGGFGKWGLGDVGTAGVPEKHGFDTFFGYYHQVHAHNYYPEYLWRNSQKVPLEGNAGGGRKEFSHSRILAETLKFIRENKDRPFFCYAPWTLPHGRYEVPADDPAWQAYQDKPWPEKARQVAAMVSILDRGVGEVLATLKEAGIDDRTIVFFCSDNGAADRFEGTLDSCGRFRGMKRDLYEGGIRVPMIARWPGRIAPEAEPNPALWYFPDVLPTFMELAGAETPAGLDGISVVPTLLGEAKVGRRQTEHGFLYWEEDMRPGKGGAAPLVQAVRIADYKAVRRNAKALPEIYDMSIDPGESRDLAPDLPDLVVKVLACMKVGHTDPRPQKEPQRPKGQAYA